MKLIKRFFRFIDKKIIVPITKFFVSIGEKLKLSDKPLEKALSKKCLNMNLQITNIV